MISRHPFSRLAGVSLICLGTVLLAACGAGGEGQDPDPVVVDHPVAYVKRPLPVETVDGETVPRQEDIRLSQVFQAGGDLYLRDRASPSALERNLTASVTQGAGDVRDVSASFDGGKLLFSLRLPEIEGADPEDQPTWNIWEYDLTENRLRRIIASDITAEEGQDRFPHYLPDGRIVFSSSRQRQAKARLLDEGKPQYAAMEDAVDEPAMVLHVMTADGSDIRQISFNKSHDFAPTVLDDGRIVFSRWDNFDGRDAISLYSINPDGTELQLLYGANSHDTGSNGSTIQFMQPREMPDGRILALLTPFNSLDGGGAPVLIDSPDYVEIEQPTWNNLGLGGSAQSPATTHLVATDGAPSPGGRFRSIYPLRDGTDRLLATWSPCRLLENGVRVLCTEDRLANPDAVEAAPLYGPYIYDMREGTQLPLLVPREGFVYTDLVAAQAQPLPAIRFDKSAGAGLDEKLLAAGVAALHIHSVYDMDGSDQAVFADGTPASIPQLADPAQATAAQRPARFLRIVKQVTIPDRDVYDFAPSAYGRTRAFGMREVVGYAPIEPDGSVKVRVPADVPLTFSILDANGRRIGQPHRYSLQFRAGELVECGGCHDADSNLPHGRLDAVPPPVNPGGAGGGLPFANAVAELWSDEPGETMAETRGRLQCDGACAPSMDLGFLDHWTDESLAGRPPDAAFNYCYTGPDARCDSVLTTQDPLNNAACADAWNGLCLAIIHYEEHIHPLWDLPRPVLDDAGLEIDNHRCTRCHNDRDAMDLAMEPAGQLDLSDGAVVQGHFPAYRELLFPDDLQVVVDGALIDLLVPAVDANGNPLFETDADGNLVLDEFGNPIPLPDVTVPAPGPSMRAGSANGGYFLSLFDTGGIHQGYLSEAEKRLIGEWIDIGAQYYNNPFDAPLDE